MKICHLHLAEAAGGNVGGDKILRAMAGAAKGVGGAILFLFSVIYHGLVGKAVAAGTIKPSKAAKAYALDRKRAIRKQAEKEGIDIDDPKPDLKSDPDKLETLHILEENEPRYLAIAQKMAELEAVDLPLGRTINRRFEKQYRQLCFMLQKEGLTAAAVFENKMLTHIENILNDAIYRYKDEPESEEAEPEAEPEEESEPEEVEVGV